MNNVRKIQERILQDLLRKAERTLWGKRYDFSSITNYRAFQSRIPVFSYGSLDSAIKQIKSGDPDILWPGRTNYFAVSSGTTGEGKHLPLSRERLHSDQKFMQKLIRHFIVQWPEPQIWMGKQASLPGSIETVLMGERYLLIGEISGFTAGGAPGWLAPFQVMPPRKLCRMPWKEKFDVCLHNAIKNDVRVISAVPSWTLIFLQEAIRLSGCSIDKLWPDLKLIVSGGVALKNYRKAIEDLCVPLKLQFIESYGASEGYFAFSRKLSQPELQLVIDNGIFYEWVPFDAGQSPGMTEEIITKNAVPSWQLEIGKDYIMIVTTNAGLWRYPVNDVIRITNMDPLCIEVRGRTSEVLDDYGEAVHYSELESALSDLKKTISSGHCRIFASVYSPTKSSPPFHIWMIEWDRKPGYNEIMTARHMDEYLISVNRHYAIRRESLALGDPVVLFLTDEHSKSLSVQNQRSKAQDKPQRIIPFDDLPDRIKDHFKNPGYI